MMEGVTIGLVHQNASWDLWLAILCHIERSQESSVDSKNHRKYAAT